MDTASTATTAVEQRVDDMLPTFSWAASNISHLLPEPEPEPELGDDEPVRTKRPRVALACTRCKARKQKCDGRTPCCAKCAQSDARCEYIVPQKPMPFGKNQYIKSLERRVAELETLLAGRGLAEVGTDHWKLAATATSTAGEPASSVASAAAMVPLVSASMPSAPSAIHTDASTGAAAATGTDDTLRRYSEGWSKTSSPQAAGVTPSMDPDEAVLEWQDGLDSVVSVLRSLSLDVNGQGYIGASSHVTLGRLFNFLGRGPREQQQQQQQHLRRRSSSFRQQAASATTAESAITMASGSAIPTGPALEPIDFADVPSSVADRLYVGYTKNVMTRFPLLHSVWLREIHHRRHALADEFETTMLHLVYAVSGRFIETTGESGPYDSKRHYASAMRGLDTMLEYNDIRTVQVLLLMAIYCLRDSAGPGVWTCSRMALQVAIDHGLHRQTKAVAHRRSLESELRKRLFWACYCFDRQISIPMGRPLGISDRDIDIALPLDIDEDVTEAELAVMPLPVRASPTDPSTSLTSFVLIAQLRHIESDIQETIYRVDRATAIDDRTIDGFLDRLEQWKAMIPHDTRVVRDVPGCPYDGYNFYMVFYYKCQRLLLYPVLSDHTVSPRFLKECARACAGVCCAYKRLHQTMAVGYSFMALQNVFIAGLTLVYCIWLCPGDIFDMATSNGIHDCSIMLFVIAERVPAAKKYRNAFELIRQRVIDQISSLAPDHRQPRTALAGLTDELAPSANAFEVNMPFEVGNGSFEQFSQIITDMSGGENFLAGLNRFQAELAASGGGGGGGGGGHLHHSDIGNGTTNHAATVSNHHHHHPHPFHDPTLAQMTFEPVFNMTDL